MAADQTNKRLNIAAEAIAAAVKIYDSVKALVDLDTIALEAGEFLDSDFAGTDLKHITALDITTLFASGVEILQFLEGDENISKTHTDHTVILRRVRP